MVEVVRGASELLFSRGNLVHALARRSASIAEAVAASPSEAILAADADEGPLRTALASRYRLEVPVLDLNGIALERTAPAASGSRKATRSSVTASVPFRGDRSLFEFHPGWYLTHLPRGLVGRGLLRVIVPDEANLNLKESVDEVLFRINTYLSALRAKADEFNRALPVLVGDAIRARAQALTAEGHRFKETGYRVLPGSARTLVQGRRVAPIGTRFLSVATEWSSGHGGLSSFNRELCKALASAGMSVACLVLRSTVEERQKAAAHGVTLVDATPTIGLPEELALTRRPNLPAGFIPDVIIGHGRVTGPAAKVICDDHFEAAKRLHFVHMAPDEIEWFKLDREDDAGERAERRTKIELTLGRTATRVIAVGPRLHQRYVADLHPFGAAEPLRFDPGFVAPKMDPSPVPRGAPWRVLFLGRAEDEKLKGLDLAARAVGLAAIHLVGKAPSLEFLVRGAKVGQSEALQKRLLKEAGNSPIRVVVRPFTTDSAELEADMARASLVVMPSRSEGFGLVGLEAIGAGTPVLISGESGLGALLREVLEMEESTRTVLSVTRDVAHDAQLWAKAIEGELRDREESFMRVAGIRDDLANAGGWQSSIEALLTAI